MRIILLDRLSQWMVDGHLVIKYRTSASTTMDGGSAEIAGANFCQPLTPSSAENLERSIKIIR